MLADYIVILCMLELYAAITAVILLISIAMMLLFDLMFGVYFGRKIVMRFYKWIKGN